MEAETKKQHRCAGGPLNGYEFSLRFLTAKISYGNGYYRRSAVTEADGVTLWHWHYNGEKPQPAVNPQ